MAMTPCSEWSEALRRRALGEPAEAALEAHLASCPACSEALAAWRAKAGQLDAALRELTAMETPAYGPERVLARIRLQPARRFHRGWSLAALAALVFVAGLMVTLRRPPRPELTLPPAVTALSAWRSPTQWLLRSPADRNGARAPSPALASPTQWLLRSPADRLLNEVPRLGEGFIETKSSGGKNAQ